MSLIARLHRFGFERSARLLEPLVAGLLTVGALTQVPRHRSTTDIVIGVICAVIATTTVAWRRRAPATAVGVAVAAVLVYQLATSDTQMTFEPFAILLTYYTYGKDVVRRSRLLTLALLGFTLAVLAITFAHLHQEVFGNTASALLLFALVPCLGGAVIDRRAAMTSELASTMVVLKAEQVLSAAARADDERNRIARELHDVIAHCVSVMVIQAGGARLVVHRDLVAARAALGVVVASGREALSDLRRITGVWLKDDRRSAAAPGLAQLDSLVDRARSAGLPIRLDVVGPVVPLAPDVGLVAYRVVQEALTNAVKHSGCAVTNVRVSFGADQVGIVVTDAGAGTSPGPAQGMPGGHGLVGMRERVTHCGGELHAGQIAGGGWEVRARLPFTAPAAVPQQRVGTSASFRPAAPSDRRWLDVVIALVWLVALEADALTSVHISGPRWFNVAAVGVAALAAIGRRQHPMTYLIVVGVCSAALTNGLTSSDYATVTGVYSVLIPTYTIGAWLPRRRGLQLMCVWVVCAELLIAATGPTVSGTIGPLLAGGVAFAAGLVMRSQRELIVSLREASRRLVDERADRERLAVASERARLTRDLHETVAGGVTAMVVQAEAALNMMARDPDSTHESLSAVDSITSIETSGREVLVQLRHILGVLRHGGGAKQLTPQPGLGEVHQLLERSREQGRPVDFRVVGDPGNLLAGLDMATYRILEDVLEDPGWDQGESLTVTLRFSDRDVEIDLCTGSPGGRSWPALAIRQRVAMFNGDVHLSSRDDATSQMIIRLPRVIEGALA